MSWQDVAALAIVLFAICFIVWVLTPGATVEEEPPIVWPEKSRNRPTTLFNGEGAEQTQEIHLPDHT